MRRMLGTTGTRAFLVEGYASRFYHGAHRRITKIHGARKMALRVFVYIHMGAPAWDVFNFPAPWIPVVLRVLRDRVFLG